MAVATFIRGVPSISGVRAAPSCGPALAFRFCRAVNWPWPLASHQRRKVSVVACRPLCSVTYILPQHDWHSPLGHQRNLRIAGKQARMRKSLVAVGQPRVLAASCS